MIEHIVAVDSKNGIARDGVIPWDLPGDKRFYRSFIAGKRLIVGRKTYEQTSQKTGGYMFVVTSRGKLQPSLKPGWGEIVPDLPLFLEQNGDEPLVVIGGQRLYEDTLSHVGRLHITRVDDDFACDVFYPTDLSGFTLVSRSRQVQENGLSYHFETYERVQ